MSNDRLSSGRGSERSAARGLVRRVTRLLSRSSRFDPLDGDGPDAQAESAWRPCIKRRTFVLLSVLALWTAGIEARLVWLQVVRHDDLVTQATLQQENIIALEATRGDIVDRHGTMLARSVEADSILATPTAIKPDRKAATAKALCDALGDCSPKDRADLLAGLSQQTKYLLVRKSRSLSPAQVQRVAALNLTGVYFDYGTRRYYPRLDLASHVLGFVSTDNVGLAGVEFSHDEDVRGVAGQAIAQVDGRQHRMQSQVTVPPIPGGSLELTIDLNLQFIAERELKAGIEANRAVAGTVVIMDPSTGEVFALASYPTFNPNAAGRANDDERLNRAIQTVYEPGSTFKVVTASAALEEGIVGPTDLIDTNPGSITVPGRKPIPEAGNHNYGVLSFEDVIVKSSNVGAIKIGQRVGRELIARYVERFGFGHKATPDLPGESPGIWRPADLDASGLASVSMGYQISVTPIQMAAAVSSVANGGLLFEPHLVRAHLRGGHRETVAPKMLRRTISPTTAATLTTMMEAVVERGTATAAQLEGYQIAGKTGTAHKAIPGHGYSNTDFFASFVGFVPSRKPVFTILVVIDTPRGGTHFGGLVAAPIFKAIAAAALQQAGVPSSINPVPPVIIRSQPEAPAHARVATPVVVPAGGVAVMPDVRGLAAREATRVLGRVGLTVSMTGSGFVVKQSPEPGTPVHESGHGFIVLGRRPTEVALAEGAAW